MAPAAPPPTASLPDCCGSLTCVAKDAPKNCNDVDCTQGGLEACTCLKGRCGARIRFRENSIPNP
ncbi:MAG: hypothetical protein IPF92_15515 [Myxococcales bacterium]|nr:hypothetical protein [Myxococcales bacterium]